MASTNPSNRVANDATGKAVQPNGKPQMSSPRAPTPVERLTVRAVNSRPWRLLTWCLLFVRRVTTFTMLLLLTLALSISGIVVVASLAQGHDPREQAEELLVDLRRDPIRKAVWARKLHAEWHEKLHQQLAATREKMENFEPAMVSKEHVLLEDYRKILPILHEQAKWLVENHILFQEVTDGYSTSLKKQIVAIRASSEKYRQFAAMENDALLKQQYEHLANHAQLAASSLEANGHSLQEKLATVEQKIQFVERSVVFLERLELFIEMYPSTAQAAQLEEYLRELDAYLDAFQISMQLFEEISQVIDTAEVAEASE